MKSILLINGNDPKAILNSTLYGADAIAFDLYQMVPQENKDAARILVQEALGFMDFGTVPPFVRVNPLGSGLEQDLEVVCSGKPAALLLPLADAGSVAKCDELLAAAEKKHNLPVGGIKLLPQLESIAAIEDVGEVLVASPRVIGAIFGAQNLLSEMGVKEVDQMQLAYARSRVVLACLRLKLPAYDRAWLNVKDMKGFEADARHAHDLGYKGKVAAGGNQVAEINKLFA